MSYWSPALDLPASYERAPSDADDATRPLYFRLPTPALVAVGVAAALGLLTPNPLLTAAAILVLPLMISLTWRPGEPPVFPFVLGFHWAQAATKVFHADILGVGVEELTIYSQYGAFARLETASWLSLIGLVVLALGIRVAIRTLAPPDEDALRREVESISISKAFWLYLAVTLTALTLQGSVGRMSGFREILNGAIQLKWVMYFVVSYLALTRREGYVYFAVALVFEFVAGIGFFSGFKEVLFKTVIVYFTARSQITLGTMGKALAMLVVLAVLGATWTAVKADFRGGISGGEGQGSSLAQGEQIDLLVGFVSELDGGDVAEAIEPMAWRLAYVDFFGYALSTVPATVPHEDGALWGAAVKHIFMPRILFPSKPEIVSDSEITNRYTNLGVAGDAEGTSFSIGYMAESYVDFGPVWMFLPLFLIGVWRGLMYRFFVRKKEMMVMGYAFAVALFSTLYQLEIATGKLLGGLLSRFIVLAFLFILIAPRIMSFIRDWNVELDDSVDEPGGAEPGDGAALPPMRQVWT